MQTSKYLLTLVICCVFGCLHAQTNVLYRVNNSYPATTVAHTFNDADVIARLQTVQSAVPTRYTDVVKGYLRTYTIKKRSKTEAILGKSVMYFPIYEEQFRRKGIPEALKYLSVTESALNPVAVSSAKAVGLWQFMKATGKEYGLRIDDTIDERRDPHLSTAAAAEYLHKQYKRFGDWALAIAAYNSGPGNVSKAIRRGRSKNFWKIKKYLPRETRSYVPGYIAAAYILQHYEKHGLIPQYPEMDLQLTEAVKVYQFINFQTISAMTGISVGTIRALNPSFLQNYIPSTQRGYYLILPKRVMNDFKNTVARPDSKPVRVVVNTAPIYASNNNFNTDKYSISYHTVQQAENLPAIAKIYNCHPYHIKVWNELKSNYVNSGQQLKIYIPISEIPKPVKPVKVLVPKAKVFLPKIDPIRAKPVKSQTQTVIQKGQAANQAPKQYQYHIIHRNESLKEIAAQYGLSVEKLLSINQVKSGRLPMPGDKIKVKILN